MQITRLLIENLRAVTRLELDLASASREPRRRVLLLGVNGTGKTTILDAIAHIFHSLDDRLTIDAPRLGASDVRNVQDPSLEAEALLRRGSITVDAVLSEEERRAIRWLYPNPPAAGPLLFDIGGGRTLRYRLSDDLEASEADVGNIEASELADGGDISVDDPIEPDFEDAARAVLSEGHLPCVLLPADRGVLEHRDDLTIKQIMELEPGHGSLSRSRDRFAPIAARLALATIGGRSDGDRAIARMWKVLAKYFPEMPRLVDAEGMLLRFRNSSGAIVPLTALSEGERAILLIFGELSLRAPKSGMVLIDELEQHLHPRWQRAILEALVALLPSAQFVITTQSPYLAACAPDDALEVGDWKRDGE